MSRYEIKKENITIAYGYDRPLQTFFVQIFKGQKLVLDSNNRSDVIDVLAKHDAPSNHFAAVCSDLPF